MTTTVIEVLGEGSALALLRAAGFPQVREPGDGAGGAPDLVVLASTAPAAERLVALDEAVARHPKAAVAMTMPADATATLLRAAVRRGAHGIVLDDCVATTLASTVHAVLAGQLVVPMALARRLAPPPLTHREKEILGLVVRGYTNRQIAGELFLAESTVKTHLSSALRKLDARSRAEAAAMVLDPGEGHELTILPLPNSPRKIRAELAVD
jgi:DNA-binding NarL/FixJ family response regulator